MKLCWDAVARAQEMLPIFVTIKINGSIHKLVSMANEMMHGVPGLPRPMLEVDAQDERDVKVKELWSQIEEDPRATEVPLKEEDPKLKRFQPKNLEPTR